MKSQTVVWILPLIFAAPAQASPKPVKQAAAPGKLVRTGPHQHGMDCPQPLEAATAQPKGALPPPGDNWQIHAQGVGDLWIGEKLPSALLKKEGSDPVQEFMKKVKGLDSNALLNEGLVNQAGYPIIRLKNLEITLSFAQEWRVLSIEPGPSIVTKKGTGKGSSLAELKRAHGRFELHRNPEPYHCVATVPDVRWLAFRFSDCAAACQGERSKNVTVGKPNYDYMEQRWLQQPSRAPVSKPGRANPQK
ncbi:MAG: hypothetical protein CMH55_09605 [Myxococcales bacterium]|nr:hypothetical protein [Myxococcales bacterium]|tara:strand:+ start:681 stop:1424 length:744 start_codon:yes stop_codon:yes gene_type:complete